MLERNYLSSNQVLELFCAVMLKNGKYKFSRKRLTEILYQYKSDEEYNILLDGIKYKKDDAYRYSRDLEKSIMLFKIYGIIYHKGVEPTDKLNINRDIDYMNVLNNYERLTVLMDNIVSEYLSEQKEYKKLPSC